MEKSSTTPIDLVTPDAESSVCSAAFSVCSAPGAPSTIPLPILGPLFTLPSIGGTSLACSPFALYTVLSTFAAAAASNVLATVSCAV